MCNESWPGIPDPHSPITLVDRVADASTPGLWPHTQLPQTQGLEKNFIRHFRCSFLPAVSMGTSGAPAWPVTGPSREAMTPAKVPREGLESTAVDVPVWSPLSRLLRGTTIFSLFSDALEHLHPQEPLFLQKGTLTSGSF